MPYAVVSGLSAIAAFTSAEMISGIYETISAYNGTEFSCSSRNSMTSSFTSSAVHDRRNDVAGCVGTEILGEESYPVEDKVQCRYCLRVRPHRLT